MDRDVLEIKLWIVIAILAVCFLKSCDYANDQKKELTTQYSEEVEEIKSYYYYMYEDLHNDYEYLYREYEEDPNRSVPMSNFPHPDDIIFPIEDYAP